MDAAFNLKAGTSALAAVTTGGNNNAEGYKALALNTTGSYNVALGSQALDALTGLSSNNLGFGYNAGSYLTSGSNNIYLGTPGVATFSAESNVIRIGQQAADTTLTPNVAAHTKTFVAGVWGTATGSSNLANVVVDANGQLGVLQSSQRYKEEIAPMADASSRLYQLRPVSFHYKKPDASGNKPIQYGLIAEEVAEVFPELVVRNKDGSPETVAYHLLGGLLLNELQKEHAVVGQQTQELAEERVTIAAQSARLDAQALALAAERDLVATQAREVSELKQQTADVQALREEVSKLSSLRQELNELRQVTAKLIKKGLPKALKSANRTTTE
jgi:hypothetical protein